MFGQYDGYHDVAGVAAGSTTKTYAAVSLACDSWRWADVPILIRAGKSLAVTSTEISFQFAARRTTSSGSDSAIRNELRFRIWPEVAVGLTLVGSSRAPGGTSR